MRDPTPADHAKAFMDEDPWTIKAQLIDKIFPVINRARGINRLEDVHSEFDLHKRFIKSEWSTWLCTGRVPNPMLHEIAAYMLKTKLVNPYIRREFDQKKEIMERTMVCERGLWALKEQLDTTIGFISRAEYFEDAARELREAGERPTRAELLRGLRWSKLAEKPGMLMYGEETIYR
ncbi:hypothetical protein B0H67DRAFT_642149 [Lasiosphaeris hirsuta]|uniref:Uncharacterized protein n=1 Tax=Lasiosphaeris hirsuta TaxID=260670 RepID=A0AA40B1J0_9PEZI|nr:hypothetical protein B0H67DRAFT_642149 [Lasiosphaeris hirsuta]